MNDFRVPSRTRLADATEAIRRMVLNGAVSAGERLRDFRLAEMLGVSRPTVREAIRTLVDEGTLVYEPFKGIRVAHISDQALLDIAEVRAAIEKLAAMRLAQRFDSTHEARLREILQRLDAAHETHNPAQLHEAHFAFHRMIHQLAEIPLLERLWTMIEAQTRLALRIDQDFRPDYNRIVRDHRTYFEALRRHDSEAIGRLVSDHIMHSALAVLKERSKTQGTSGSPGTEKGHRTVRTDPHTKSAPEHSG